MKQHADAADVGEGEHDGIAVVLDDAVRVDDTQRAGEDCRIAVQRTLRVAGRARRVEDPACRIIER